MAGKAAALTLVAILAIVSGAQGRHLLQGTNSTSTVVVRWAVPANGVLDAVRVPLGGNVTFSWTGLHDVWEIPSAQCPSTFANSSTVRRIAAQSTGGSVTVPFNATNVRYFACSVSTHCSEGQLIAVRVNGATAPAPAPGGRAVAPTRTDGVSGYGGNSSPGYAGGASSNYGSSGSNNTSSGTSSGYGGSSSSGSSNSGYGADGVNRTPGYGGGSSSNYGSSSGSGR